MINIDIGNASGYCAVIQQWQSYVLTGDITVK